jgi:hypothetical protein
MKKLITAVILFGAAVSAPAATAAKKTDKTATTHALIIPKDAVKNQDGTYSYTDKQGKKWVYSNSPFGVMRSAVPEADAEARPAPGGAAGATKAIDKGDSIQFVRSSPFGQITWEKKKSELTDEERHIMDAQDPNQTAKPDSK